MSAWSCSFTKHELHLRVTAKCCKSFFLALKTRFTPLQSFSCACKFYLRLQSYVHFHKSYHTHANLYDVKLPSYILLLLVSVIHVLWNCNFMLTLNKYDLHSYDFHFSALTLLARFFRQNMEVFLRLKDLHAYGKICESVHKTASANKICKRKRSFAKV